MIESNTKSRTYRLATSAGLALLVSLPLGLVSNRVQAVAPSVIDVGRQLFEKNWTSSNPALVGRDGLGPLFNGQSCVACHRQGGVGGAGEAEFNAKTISIETMKITGGPVNADIVRQAVRGFHPGFIDPKAGVLNSLSLSHHGGTAGFDQTRKQFMKQVPVIFSENGGPVSAAEVRRANATPILYNSVQGNYQTNIKAWMFQRNTTPLFGAGLIDQVTAKQLRIVEREQKKHPEISGRLSTLPDGRLGRFGWRSNVPTLLNFCDQACAAEVGLETNRINQPTDPMTPNYRNPTVDISDNQIRAMAAFVAALPAPTREIPESSEDRQIVGRGEQVFNSIGCAVCHLPSLGPAQGLYSDLLLHDMGPNNYDLNPADPYIYEISPETEVHYAVDSVTTQTTTMGDDRVMGTGYYGGSYSMEPESVNTTVESKSEGSLGEGRRSSNRGRPNVRNRGYSFIASRGNVTRRRIIPVDVDREKWTENSEGPAVEVTKKVKANERTESGSDTYTVTEQISKEKKLTQTTLRYLRLSLEPTLFTQEWRTPPLWGVRDSAPYMHDGRAETLLESITMHEGEAKGTRDRFLTLSVDDRHALIEFLKTMVAPPNVPQPRS